MTPPPVAACKARAGGAGPPPADASGGGVTILGIDPGLNATGYGIIDVAPEERMRVLAAGAVKPSARQPLARRLHDLYDTLTRIVDAHHPQLMVLESLFTHHAYVTTAALMGHARGVACLVGAEHDMRVIEYLPKRVKKAVTGNGAASKEQVARAVGMWLGLETSSWASDVTDALALAIAHAQMSRSRGRILAGAVG